MGGSAGSSRFKAAKNTSNKTLCLLKDGEKQSDSFISSRLTKIRRQTDRHQLTVTACHSEITLHFPRCPLSAGNGP